MVNDQEEVKFWGTAVFYRLLILAAVYLVVLVFSTGVKTVSLKEFHLKQDNFGVFALVHFIPPMYSFANEVWYSQELVDFSTIVSRPGVPHFWFNHYPLRFVTFGAPREFFFQQAGPQYVYVRSRYMGHALESIYELKRTSRGIVMSPVR